MPFFTDNQSVFSEDRIILQFCIHKNMQFFMSQKGKQIASRVLLVIFTLYYVNICFFYHGHIINGVTIVHSHIHSKAHAQTGTHGDAELTLISALSTFQSLQAAFYFFGIGLFLLSITIFRIGSEQKPVSIIHCHSYLRAPPALF